MRYLLDIVYGLAILCYSPVAIYKSVRHNRYRLGWDNRFGKIKRRTPTARCIWIHAVSLGEVNATRTIVKALLENISDIEIVISTTTDTGYERAKKLYGKEHSVFFFPFDFSFVMQRAFENLKPTLCILMELEVWPNFMTMAKENNAFVVVANGRISDRSFPRYQRFKSILKPIFAKIDLVLAQTQEYAERFIAIGCDKNKVSVCSSLKYDTAEITNHIKATEGIAQQLNLADSKILVAGGTGPGEEKILLDVYKKIIAEQICDNLKLIVVPRKPERFDEVARLIEDENFKLCRFSQYKNDPSLKANPDNAVILVDTMGDLRKFYCLCDIAFVGRSLVPMGGSDMIEAAALGKTTIFGPYTFNFKHTVDVLLKGRGAVEVKNSVELFNAISKCLTDEQYAQKTAENGQNIIRQNQGATEKTVKAVAKLIENY